MQMHTSFAQEKTLSLDVKNTSLNSVLNQLESTFDIRFSYSDQVISEEKITLQLNKKTLDDILKILNKKTNFNFETISERNIIILKKVKDTPLEIIHNS